MGDNGFNWGRGAVIPRRFFDRAPRRAPKCSSCGFRQRPIKGRCPDCGQAILRCGICNAILDPVEVER